MTPEERRERTNKTAKEKTRFRNPLDFSPDLGKEFRIRLLPLQVDEGWPYITHPYHYLPMRGGIYVSAHLYYTINGKQVKDPIQAAADKLWDTLSKVPKDDKSAKTVGMRKLANALKNKRRYYAHMLLVDEPDVAKKYRVLIDTDTRGPLMRIICRLMLVPLMRAYDEEQWAAKDTLSYPAGRKLYELLDYDQGHDLVVVQTATGTARFERSFESSFVIDEPRSLSDVERSLLDSRVDLRSHVKYEEGEEGYARLKTLLEEFYDTLESSGGNVDALNGSTETDNEGADPTTGVLPEAKPAEVQTKQETTKETPKPKDVTSIDKNSLDDILDEVS